MTTYLFETPGNLHHAILQNLGLEKVKELLEKDPNLLNQNDPNYDNETPLLLACWGDDSKDPYALFLIEQGADVNAVEDAGWTPLMNACYNKRRVVVKRLIEAGADINPVNKYGKTAFTINNGEFAAELKQIINEVEAAKQSSLNATKSQINNEPVSLTSNIKENEGREVKVKKQAGKEEVEKVTGKLKQQKYKEAKDDSFANLKPAAAVVENNEIKDWIQQILSSRKGVREDLIESIYQIFADEHAESLSDIISSKNFFTSEFFIQRNIPVVISGLLDSGIKQLETKEAVRVEEEAFYCGKEKIMINPAESPLVFANCRILFGSFNSTYFGQTKHNQVAIKVFKSSADCFYEFNKYLEIIRRAEGQSTGCIHLYNLEDNNPQYLVLEKLQYNLKTFMHPSCNQKHVLIELIIKVLDEFHQLGNMHGDIRPENILVSLDPVNGSMIVKLADLECSAEFGQLLSIADGQQKVSLDWVSPEVYLALSRGENTMTASSAIDIFSVGLICAALISSTFNRSSVSILPTVHSADDNQLHELFTNQEALFASLGISDLRNPLHVTIQKCCLLNPTQRYTSKQLYAAAGELRKSKLMSELMRARQEHEEVGEQMLLGMSELKLKLDVIDSK